MNIPRKIGTLIKTSLVDFPGIVSCAVFFKNCNLRCPYCYNGPLVLGTEKDENLSSFEEIISHLEKRKNVISGLVISGGEALLDSRTPLLITEAKKLGYKIKLDTNGTLPEKLKELLDHKTLSPDFVAMDIKTSLEKYSLLLSENTRQSENITLIQKKILSSIEILKKIPPEKREFRTVLVPPLVTKEDIKKMASILPPDADWKFASFINKGCLSAGYDKISPYTAEEEKILVEYASSLIKGASLR